MNSVSFGKIQEQAQYLKSIFLRSTSVEEIPNFRLFDEPYKLALSILESNRSDEDTAAVLGLNKETVRQVRRALDV